MPRRGFGGFGIVVSNPQRLGDALGRAMAAEWGDDPRARGLPWGRSSEILRYAATRTGLHRTTLHKLLHGQLVQPAGVCRVQWRTLTALRPLGGPSFWQEVLSAIDPKVLDAWDDYRRDVEADLAAVLAKVKGSAPVGDGVSDLLVFDAGNLVQGLRPQPSDEIEAELERVADHVRKRGLPSARAALSTLRILGPLLTEERADDLEQARSMARGEVARVETEWRRLRRVGRTSSTDRGTAEPPHAAGDRSPPAEGSGMSREEWDEWLGEADRLLENLGKRFSAISSRAYRVPWREEIEDEIIEAVVDCLEADSMVRLGDYRLQPKTARELWQIAGRLGGWVTLRDGEYVPYSGENVLFDR